LDHPEDFEERKMKYLPLGLECGKRVLSEIRFPFRLTNTQCQDVEIEAHNGLGAVYMRMGQNAHLFPEEPEKYWANSQREYEAALALRPTMTPTLQNLGTLYRLQAEWWLRQKNEAQTNSALQRSLEYYTRSLAINPYDQFPFYGAAIASANLGDWETSRGYYSDGRDQPGKVGADKWDRLSKAIQAEKSQLIPSEESSGS